MFVKGDGDMKQQLIKAMQRNQSIDIMYISKSNSITKRRIKLIKLAGDKIQAYCFIRQAKRTFILDNVLAVIPVIAKERTVM